MNYLDTFIFYTQQYLLNPQALEFLRPLRLPFIFFAIVFFVFILYFYKTSQYWNILFFMDLKEFLAYKPSTAIDRNRKWSKIMRRMDSDLESEHKLALIEAEEVFETLLFEKYKDETYEAQFEKAKFELGELAEFLTEAKKARDAIVNKPTIELPKEQAREYLGIYGKALKKLHWL